MIEWGDRSRPVARWIPLPIVRVFDRWADWMDVEVFVIRAHRLQRWWDDRSRFERGSYPAPILWSVERWDIANVVLCIALSIGYSLYLGSWLKGLTLGPLMYVFGWMAFRWFAP